MFVQDNQGQATLLHNQTMIIFTKSTMHGGMGNQNAVI
jgi:hypothetical protein